MPNAQRASKVVHLRALTEVALNETMDRLKAQAQRTAEARAKLFVIPRSIRLTPLACAIRDMETRNRWPTLTDSQRNTQVAAINSGDKAFDHALHALARDLYGTPISQWARAVHRDRVAAANPQPIVICCAATNRTQRPGDSPQRKPIEWIVESCARATTGRAKTPPTTRPMNALRSTSESPRRKLPTYYAFVGFAGACDHSCSQTSIGGGPL